MSTKTSGHFSGFSSKSIDFLINLGFNNNKQWFQENKLTYTENIVKPCQQLIMDINPTMLTIDPEIETNPARVISRINRDVRFSKDKSPYRSNVWLTFKRPVEEWQDNPCFFFELFPSWYRFGMGYYCVSKDMMDKIRKEIDERPDRFKKAVSFFYNREMFTLEGDKYKRILNPGKSQELQEWYQRKNLYLSCNRKIDNRLFTNELINDLNEGFCLLSDFYHYLYKIKES